MPTYPELRGRTVVVTGAARGLGRGIAEGFLEAGAHVVAVVRTQPTWSPPAGSHLETVIVDVCDTAGLERWIRSFEERGGRIHAWVNNAGVLTTEALIDASRESYSSMFATNVEGTFFASQVAARHMRRGEGGVIVNIGSYATRLASVGGGLYAASKAALASLTRSMAAEWAPYGIRVNALSPGVVPTDMTRPALDVSGDAMVRDLALHRFGTPEEIAEVALFLASDGARYMTGEDLGVTGGKLVVQKPAAAWPSDR